MKNIVLAYIDPGTGSLVLQMLIASLIGAGLFLRNSIGRLFFRAQKEDKPSPTPPKTGH